MRSAGLRCAWATAGAAGAAAALRTEGAGAPPSCSLNWLTALLRCSACSRSDSEAAVDSSTSAAFCCVIWSSWLTDGLIWPMLSLCSADEAVISAMMSDTRRTLLTISVMVCPAWLTRRDPSSTRSTDEPIRPLISLAASALRCARLRTSLATTAKPRPCSPARAASTAAFNARMLVWKAMESMTPVMSAILRELVVIWSMVVTTWDTTAPPRAATSAADEAKSLAWREDWALCCTVLVSSSMDEAVSSRLAAVCSVRWLRSWLPLAISELAVVMLPAASCTWRTRPRKASCMRHMADTSWPTSSWFMAATSRERSPLAMRSASSCACPSDLVMERTLKKVSGISTANPSTSQLRALDLLEDGGNAGFILLDLVQGFVGGGHKLCIARLHLTHLGQALAQGSQGLGPGLAQGRDLDRVVEIDDDVFFGPAQVTQGRAQVGHISQGLHPLRKQLLQCAPGAVQGHIAHGANDDQKNQRKNGSEVKTCADREAAESIHGSSLHFLTDNSA